MGIIKHRMKIGEYALGGIIDIEIDDNAQITIIARDLETKQPVLTGLFSFIQKHKLTMWLENEITSCYYAEKIINKIYY